MNVKRLVMERGMKLMSDPRVMKLMSNPKVMNLVMKGFQLRGKAQASVDAQVKALAKSLKLATRDEVDSLKSTIRTLEKALKEVQAELAQKDEKPAKKSAKA
jgi:Tfp pilus assembly protein FimV